MVHNFNEDGEDVFFDSVDSFDTSAYAVFSEEHLIKEPQLKLDNFKHVFGNNQLLTVEKRRKKFFEETGFDKLLLQFDCSWKQEKAIPFISMDDRRISGIRQTSVTEFELPSPSADSRDSNSNFYDNKTAESFLENQVREACLDDDVRTEKFPPWVQQSNEFDHDQEKQVGHVMNKCQIKTGLRWLKSKLNLVNQKRIQIDSRFFTMLRIKQKNQNNTETTAPKIEPMQLSPSGMYLATGGEDCIVRIWRVREVEATCSCLITDCSTRFGKRAKPVKFKFEGKGFNNGPAVIAGQVLLVDEMPIHEFSGHTSDILDLAWSKSDILLSASKDKTVRMWKVGFQGCVRAFLHRDYVTCIQFNPVDERYFLSGSIDGKVRIWSIYENRVVNWADTRSIVTAICYKRDGQGFVVGSTTGKCRFYVCSGNTLQLDGDLFLRSKRKSLGKGITCLQYSAEHPERVFIASSDSTIWIYDGYKLIFRGSHKWNSVLSASSTANKNQNELVGDKYNGYIKIYNSSLILTLMKNESICNDGTTNSEGVSTALSLSSAHNLLSVRPAQTSGLNRSHRDPYVLKLGSCFFPNCSRSSATWPEEKLPLSST